MADINAFWRDLEARFRALHDEQLQNRGSDALHALWSSKGFDCADGSLWDVGGGTEYILKQFEWLAESAAVRLGHSGGPDAVSFWLDRLKAESPHFPPFESSSWEKGKLRHWNSGRIEFVCKASAEYCLKCETQQTLEQRARAAFPARATNQKGSVNDQPINHPQPYPLDANPDVAKRRALIRQNPRLDYKKLCKTFDTQDAPVPVPESW